MPSNAYFAQLRLLVNEKNTRMWRLFFANFKQCHYDFEVFKQLNDDSTSFIKAAIQYNSDREGCNSKASVYIKLFAIKEKKRKKHKRA